MLSDYLFRCWRADALSSAPFRVYDIIFLICFIYRYYYAMLHIYLFDIIISA